MICLLRNVTQEKTRWEMSEKCREKINCGGVGVDGVRKWFGTPLWLSLGVTREDFPGWMRSPRTPEHGSALDQLPSLWETEGFGGFRAGHDLSCCGAAAP